MTPTYSTVFTCDNSWWQLRGDDFQLADDFDADAAAFVGINTDDCESWACRVLSVDPEHQPAILPGDIAVCQGIGDDVVFVRKGASRA